MTHTQPITLIAPRPVRFIPGRPAAFRPPSRANLWLTAGSADAFPRIAEHADEYDDTDNALGLRMAHSFDRMSPRMSPRLSPRMSPSRSNYSSDALEEFLSILRPSFYQHPSSPLLNRRANGTAPAQMPDLHTYKMGFHTKSPSVSSASNDSASGTSPAPIEADITQTLDQPRRPLSFRNVNESPSQELVWSADFEYKPFLPPSPISRSNTRNPFQRHASYDTGVTAFHVLTAAAASAPLSPAGIPLPIPDADEEHALSLQSI